MYDMVLTGGQVVLPGRTVRTQVGVSGGKIAAVGENLGRARRVIDASGLYVLPGVIDAHVHFNEPGRTEWEGFSHGTRALAAGGTTCFADMPLNNRPAVVDRHTLELKLAAAEHSCYVDYALYGGAVPGNLDGGQLQELRDAGVVGCKAFLCTCGSGAPGEFQNLSDAGLYRAMEILSRLGLMLSLHCENASLCDELAASLQSAGRTGMADYLDSRPVIAEVEAVRRALYFAGETGCQVHFAHLSIPQAVREVHRARAAGVRATVETCAHYLCLDRDDACRTGALAKCSPPLRERTLVEGLWDEVQAGRVDILASDHSPCPPELKGGADLFQVWGGLSTCQNLLDVLFDEAVQKRGMAPERLMELLSGNPARLLGLPDKGSIGPGKDADIVLLRPHSPYRLTEEALYYRHRQSVYTGREIGCRVELTMVRGEVVYQLGRGFSDAPAGRFVRRTAADGDQLWREHNG